MIDCQAKNAESTPLTAEPVYLSHLRIKDDYLRLVLAGEAVLIEDGAMGTLLQAQGVLEPGQPAYALNETNPDAITEIHRAYVAAGASLVTTNTFSLDVRQSSPEAVRRCCDQAVAAARAAKPRYIAGDMSPLGVLLKPYGTLDEAEAFECFALWAQALDQAGCDLLVLETFSALEELTIAIRAAQSVSTLPLFATMSFDRGGRTFMGVAPDIAAQSLGGFGLAGLGANCSVGPEQMKAAIEAMKPYVRCPLIAKPNAGLPKTLPGAASAVIYDITIEGYCNAMAELVAAGATIIGGCCGTTPDYIAALSRWAKASGLIKENRRPFGANAKG